VLPLTRVMTDLGLPRTATLRSALPFLSLLTGAIEAALDRGDELIPVTRTRLGPPVIDPPNLFACGANYFAHLSEGALAMKSLPTLPVMFVKPQSALSGPGDPIVRPVECQQLDYEAELTVVIGKGGRRIPADRAAEHIAGYMIANDVSARDLGEGESKKLNVLQTWINGDLRQDAYAREMNNNPYEIIEWLSATTALQPGDIITTGTPSGVAMGMEAPKWLVPGDTVRIEMTGLGRMETQVCEESNR
jgi:2-keto-4-pentenoate hydratase/2-oxohepta-3-ene-1,7-dioic acid hydratase in catechol pathway